MRKIFTSILIVLIAVFSLFGLISCDKECSHEWGEWSVSTSATCSSQGTKHRKCSLCEIIQTDYIDIAEHDYDTENIVWTWNGYESAIATMYCITDSSHTRQINANVIDEVTTNATCTATGVKTYTATVKFDGVTYTATKNETLAALGHTEVTDVAVAATCEKTGLTEGSHCSVCKEVLIAQQATPKVAHTETKIEAVVATCSVEGATEGKKCSVCDEILVAPQPTSKTNHTEELVPAVAATCSENGLTEGKKCSVCDEVLVAQQPTNKLPHTETTLLGVAPSCSEEGLTEGKKCSVCGTVTVAQEPIDKLPHTEETVVGTAPTCSVTGLSDGKKCSVCKETLVAQTILPKTACDYESVVTAPTCEAQGYTTHTCSMCKDSFVDSYVDELGHKWGAWEVSGTNTIRNCTNACNCGKSQRVTAINATYTGIRLLTGESVWKDDVTVTITVSDNSTLEITDFTLDNVVMQKEGSNAVTVTFKSVSTTVSVPAIYNNLPGTTSADEFEISGVEDDAITITKYIGTATEVVIPAHINRVPVRYIGNSAFQNCTTIISITTPQSVQTIGEGAFLGCTGLSTLTLNEGLKTIKGRAFYACPITTLTIPNSVTTIETYYYRYDNDEYQGAFENCKKLTSVVIGNGLTNISRETFQNCTSLTTVVIGERVETIGDYAFAGCVLLETINYNHVPTIGNYVFEGCVSLKNIDLGTGVNSVGSYAYSGCTALTSVVIPSNVKFLGNNVFNNCTALDDVTFVNGKDFLRSFGSNVFNGCSSLDRIYYTGTASDWVLVAVSEDNSYPLNVSPYYYSENQPATVGNYWYYNGNGAKRVWNVSETSFKAEEYSEKFANSTFGSSNTSYSSQFLSQLEGDSLFQARILIWEALHIATDSSWESKAISKKDVYKMVIYDLLVGEADAQVNPLAGMDAACNSYVYDFAKFLLGKDSLTKAELDQLKNLSPLDYDYVEMVDKYFKGVDVLKEVFEMSTNLYDALYVAAQYKALSDMDTNFYLVLTEISNDGSLPWDLRNAASECAGCYRTATEALLKKIVVQEFASSTMEVLWKDFQDEAWKAVLGSVFPQVKFADLTIKGAMFLANMGFNLDACNEAYYQLEAAVGLENALRNVIKNTLPDYLRYNYKDKSEYYMYAIDMYQTSVLLGFDYSNNLLREHSKSADVNAEEKQAYENMMAQISGMKQEKATMYNNFESVIEQLYVAYYS